MEKKEFKVKIPKGYVIDEENSTFDKIVFKPVSDAVSYDDIIKKIGEYNIETALEVHSLTQKLSLSITYPTLHKMQGGNRMVKNMMLKCLSLFKLLNIARYYNGGWTPDWEAENLCYHIVKSNSSIYPKGFIVLPTRVLNYGTIYFLNKEDAQAVIDNPNFRQILKCYYK